jgi:hypothetical protein
MAPLGALSQSWVSAEASLLPLGWRISGLWRFDDLWIALSEGPASMSLLLQRDELSYALSNSVA